MPSLLDTLKKELLSFKSLMLISVFSFFYYSFSVLILNYKLLLSSLFGNFPLVYKIKITLTLLYGAISAFSALDFYLLILTAVLFGMNLFFVIKIIKKLTVEGNRLTITVGGSSIIGVVTAGCTSCGFSVLSLIGVSASFTFLPFGSEILHFIVIGLLIFSLFYSLKTYHQKIVCKIN